MCQIFNVFSTLLPCFQGYFSKSISNDILTWILISHVFPLEKAREMRENIIIYQKNTSSSTKCQYYLKNIP